MSSQVETDKPGSSSACSVCSAPMPDGSSKCEQCGATRGKEHQCPFCRAIAEPVAHPRMRFVCPVCGAPRVPARDKDFAPTKQLAAHLARARSAASSQTTWKVAAPAAAGFGVLALLLLVGVASIASPPTVALIVAALVTSMPFIFAALAWRNAGVREKEVSAELDAAWLEAAKSLAKLRGTVTASLLRDAFGVDDTEAQSLASRLGAANEIATEVTDSGDLALSMRIPEKVRVKTPTEPEAAPEVVEHPAEAAEDSQRKDRA